MCISSVDSPFISLLFPSITILAWMTELSTSRELEELQNRKAGLQEESHSLNDQQKNLDERVKVLEEKIAIEELKNNNKTTREAISQLESKIDGLERRLREVSQEPEVHEPEKTLTLATETPQQTQETAPVATETTPEDSEEEVITVAAPEEPTIAEQETFTESKSRHDKKKRKFF